MNTEQNKHYMLRLTQVVTLANQIEYVATNRNVAHGNLLSVTRPFLPCAGY